MLSETGMLGQSASQDNAVRDWLAPSVLPFLRQLMAQDFPSMQTPQENKT